MKLAKEYPEYLDSNTQPVAYLPSMKQAIELLSAPDEVKSEVTAKIEAGKSVTVREIQELKAKARYAEEQLWSTCWFCLHRPGQSINPAGF